ncbi:hypothetical protein R69658_07967 [Paraburkholderia aspalathi]|uniref:Uncharacterized protein n=1 Tax=Paraburkholderia aspalathi TaxID=1324617 RepID=A0ABM8T941_9BURK|nr:hypothetical protein R69658_07967 [Paraburkholderia aspalathi]
MKLRLLMALASTALFLAPSTAGALDSQQGQAHLVIQISCQSPLAA